MRIQSTTLVREYLERVQSGCNPFQNAHYLVFSDFDLPCNPFAGVPYSCGEADAYGTSLPVISLTRIYSAYIKRSISSISNALFCKCNFLSAYSVLDSEFI